MNFNFSKIQNFKLLVVCVLLIILIIYYSPKREQRNSYSVFLGETINSKFQEIQENEEWEQLNNILVVRRSGVFYYIDEKKIKILIITDWHFTTDVELLVHVRYYTKLDRTYRITKENFKKIAFYQQATYASYMIDAFFEIKEKVDIDYEKVSMTLELVDVKRELKTRRPIKIVAQSRKNYLGSKNPNERRAAICSKMQYAKPSDFESYRWWIGINKYVGYKKFVFYNSSIPYDRFHDLFEKEKDFIEFRDYLKVPRLKGGRIIYSTFLSLYNSVHERTMHENFVFNECFLSLFNNYDRVSVFEADELFFPETKAQKIPIDLVENSLEFNKEKYCKNDINEFLDEVRIDRPMQSNTFFYTFLYKLALDFELTKAIFDNLGIYLMENEKFSGRFELKVLYADIDEEISFSILNEEDFKYADKIMRIYELYLEDYLHTGQYKDSAFNRIFMIEFTSENSGKSAHEYEAFQFIGHHENPYNQSLKYRVPFSHGYTGHFRDVLNFANLNLYTFNIKDITVDLNYYNCVVKQINKILA